MSKLIRLTDSLYNVPVLSTVESLNTVLQYLNDRNDNVEMSLSSNITTGNRHTEYDPATKIGVLHIEGPLTYRPTILSAVCGMQSYQQIESDFRKLIDGGAQNILLWIDSPGGESFSAMETAQLLRTLADKSGIKLTGYCDGSCASAAYIFAAVCHEFIMNGDSQAGSIGCVVKLRNTSKQLQKAGIEESFVYAGSNKIPYAADGSWSTEFISDLKSKVDTLYSNFTSFVATNRKLDVKAVVNTEAKMFSAKDAVGLGLADKVMSREELKLYMGKAKTPLKPVVPTTIAKPASTKLVQTSPTPEVESVDLSVPKGYRRNPVTNHLEVDRKPILSAEKEMLRMNRLLKKLDAKSAQHVLLTTASYDDAKFEATVLRLEEGVLK